MNEHEQVVEVKKSRRLENRRWMLFAIILSVSVLTSSIWYTLIQMPGGDWEDGEMVLHDYDVGYRVTITNVSGPYEIVIPIIVLTTGGPVPELDFMGVVPGTVSVERTEHGWGLRIRGTAPASGNVRTSIEGLRPTEDEERGYSYLSMCVPDPMESEYWVDTLDAWIYSNTTGLNLTVQAHFGNHRDWVNVFGQVTWTSGTSHEDIFTNTTIEGWHLYRLEREMGPIGN